MSSSLKKTESRTVGEEAMGESVEPSNTTSTCTTLARERSTTKSDLTEKMRDETKVRIKRKRSPSIHRKSEQVIDTDAEKDVADQHSTKLKSTSRSPYASVNGKIEDENIQQKKKRKRMNVKSSMLERAGTIRTKTDSSMQIMHSPVVCKAREHVYGKVISINMSEDTTSAFSPLDKHNNTLCVNQSLESCTVCLGRRDEEALLNQEPLLVCHGHRCSRKYHLNCLDPPLQSMPNKNDEPFYCFDCDLLGTSKYLIQYFDAVEEARAEFSTSKEFVKTLLAFHKQQLMSIDQHNQINGTLTHRLESTDQKIDDNETERKRSRSAECTMNGHTLSFEGTAPENNVIIPSVKRKKRDQEQASTSIQTNVDTTTITDSKLSESNDPDHDMNILASSTLDKIFRLMPQLQMEAFNHTAISLLSSKHAIESNAVFTNKKLPLSEFDRLSELYHAAMDDSKWTDQLLQMSSKGCEAPKKRQSKKKTMTFTIDEASTSSSGKNPHRTIGPDMLVGKVVKVYCPNDNTYHCGRIVDWRCALMSTSAFYPCSKYKAGVEVQSSASELFFGNGRIGCTEFLVHFLAGMNGRKETVQRWIILEEHCVAVCTALLYAKKAIKSGIIAGWKPGELMIRSALEVLPLRDDIIEDESWGLITFFGGGGGGGADESYHVYLNLEEEAVDFFSSNFRRFREFKEQQLNLSHTLEVANETGKSPSRGRSRASYPPIQLEQPKAFDHQVPQRSKSTSVLTYDDTPHLLAMMEYEEQRRVFYWHTLPLLNQAHPKALRILDERTLPPLEIVSIQSPVATYQDSRKQSIPDDSIVPCEGDGASNDSRPTNSSSTGKTVYTPRLCPLIERGLDRLWIASLISQNCGPRKIADNMVEKSLDMIESFVVCCVPSLPHAIESLSSQRT